MKILILILTIFISGRSCADLEWKELECDEELADQLRNVRLITINNYYLYLFFEKFVISFPSPYLYNVPKNPLLDAKDEFNMEMVDDFTIFYPRENKDDMHVLSYNITAMFQGLWKGYFYTYAYLADHDQAFNLIFFENRVVDIGEKNWNALTDKLLVPNRHWSFVHWDEYKYFQASYQKYDNTVTFVTDKYKLLKVTVGHYIKMAAYFEYLRPEIVNRWAGTTIEVDHGRGIYFNYYRFSGYAGQLHVRFRHTVSMNLPEFFRCRIRPSSMRQVKGIWLSNSHHFYVFVDDYYMVFTDDILEMGLNLFNDPMRFDNVKKIKFEGTKPRIERARFKYTKLIKNELFLTFSTEVTYKAYEIDERGTKFIFANKTNHDIARTCAKQTLTIQKKTFCFEEQHYYYKPDNQDAPHFSEKRLSSISSIFHGTNVTFGSKERLHLVFYYSHKETEEKSTHVVLVTEYKYYKIMTRVLTVQEPKDHKGSLLDFEITLIPHLKSKQEVPIDEIFVGKNCMIKKLLDKPTLNCSINGFFIWSLSNLSPIQSNNPRQTVFIGALSIGILFLAFVVSLSILIMKLRDRLPDVKDIVNKINSKFNSLKGTCKPTAENIERRVDTNSLANSLNASIRSSLTNKSIQNDNSFNKRSVSTISSGQIMENAILSDYHESERLASENSSKV